MQQLFAIDVLKFSLGLTAAGVDPLAVGGEMCTIAVSSISSNVNRMRYSACVMIIAVYANLS